MKVSTRESWGWLRLLGPAILWILSNSLAFPLSCNIQLLSEFWPVEMLRQGSWSYLESREGTHQNKKHYLFYPTICRGVLHTPPLRNQQLVPRLPSERDTDGLHEGLSAMPNRTPLSRAARPPWPLLFRALRSRAARLHLCFLTTSRCGT